MLHALFWDGKTPAGVAARDGACSWSSARCASRLWARREKQLARRCARDRRAVRDDARGGRVSGQWDFQQLSLHRAGVPAARDPRRRVALAPVREDRRGWRARGGGRGRRSAAVRAFARGAPMRADMTLFAQGAMDTNTQVVAIGHYIHDRLPDASRDVPRRRRDRVLRRRPGLRHARPRHESPGRASRTTVPARGSSSSRACRPTSGRRTSPTTRGGWARPSSTATCCCTRRCCRGLRSAAGSSATTDMQVIAAIVGSRRHTASGRSNDHTGWDDRRSRRHRRHRERARASLDAARWAAATSAIRRRGGRSSRARRTHGLVIDGGRTIRGGDASASRSRSIPRSRRASCCAPAARASRPWQEPIRLPVTVDLMSGTKKLGTLTWRRPPAHSRS